MSYDFHMESADGDLLPYEDNYTFNVAQMFMKAFDTDRGIKSLDHLYGEEARNVLENAIIYFLDHWDQLEPLTRNSEWGDVQGAFNLLCRLYRWCIASPKAKLRVTY